MELVEAFVTGVLAAFVIIYAFHPKMPYPKWVLTTYKHPWMFILVIFVIGFAAAWSMRVAGLLLLATFALILDMFLFGRPIYVNANESKEGPAASTVKNLASTAAPPPADNGSHFLGLH